MSHPNTERDERVRQDDIPWCDSCKSYHDAPRDPRHKVALGCNSTRYFPETIQIDDAVDDVKAIRARAYNPVQFSADVYLYDVRRLLHLCPQLNNRAATRMRDACVQKVRSMKLPLRGAGLPDSGSVGGSAYDAAIEAREKNNALLEEVAAALESLTNLSG